MGSGGEWAFNVLFETARFGAGPFIGYLIIKFTWAADGYLSKEARESLARRLIQFRAEPPKNNWPSVFSKIFDRIFGQKHLTWKCFFKSCLASLVAVSFLALFFKLFPDLYPFIFKLKEFPDAKTKELMLLIIPAFIINLLPDYVSLLETRYLLRWMSRTNSARRIAGLLILDFFITGGIFLAFSGWIMIILYILFPGLWGFLLVTAVGFFITVFWGAIAFWSTYVTSVWLWLHGVAYLALRIATKSIRGVRFLQWSLAIDTYPVRCIGLVSGLIACVLGMVLSWFS